MSNLFFEIKNGNFVASEKNKVNNVNLTIEKQGDIVSLLGPSGVGKTTILRTVAGLQKIKNGSIELKGKIISSSDVNVEPEDRNISLGVLFIPFCFVEAPANILTDSNLDPYGKIPEFKFSAANVVSV